MKIVQIVLVFIGISLLVSCKSDTDSKRVENSKPQTNKNSKLPTKTKGQPRKVLEKEPGIKINNAILSQTITLNNIDYNLISARLFQKINKERKRLGLPLFKNNNNLKKAAIIHNDYMVSVNILDHNEAGTSTPELRDRVDKAGGKFRTAGENIQYEGFIIRTTDGVESIVAPTYEALAEQLWQNWKTSPPHYKNLTNPDFIYLGTALKWSSKKTAVFATQVYGG